MATQTIRLQEQLVSARTIYAIRAFLIPKTLERLEWHFLQCRMTEKHTVKRYINAKKHTGLMKIRTLCRVLYIEK